MPMMMPLLPSSSLAGAEGIMQDSCCSGVTQTHFRNLVRDHELGLGSRHDLGHASSRTGLKQGCPTLGKTDHRQFGYDEIHRTHRCDRKRAFLDNLRGTLRAVLHGNNDALGTGDEID